MERYEEWDMAMPPLSPRSRLYPLEPIGKGTPYIESLTSYIIRLADAHCVSPKILITQEILDPLGKLENLEYNNKTYLHHLWARNAPLLNGTGWWPNDCVRVLETRTLLSGLRFLTMIPWSNVVAQRMMVRSTQFWCPACYVEWRETGQKIYNPLIWSLQAVAMCPRHRQPLRSICPYENCQRSLPFIAIRSRIGYCSYCNRWLGIACECNRCDDRTAGYPKERLYWDAIAVGELIANAPSVAIPPEREHISLAIKSLSEQITQGNISFLAHRLGMTEGTMQMWQRGAEIPQLGQLLQLSFCAGLSLFQFLTMETASSLVFCTTSANGDSPIIERGRHKRLNPDELQGLLENVLLEDPPPSLKEVALRLGYRSSDHLSRRFPDLRRAINERYKQWISASASANWQMRKPLKAEQLQKMLEATLTSGEMPLPSLLTVAQRLGYRSVDSIYRRFPDLCRAITAKRKEYQEQFNRRLLQSLEAVLKDPCGPIPSLVEIAEQLGCSTDILSARFPKLCHEITVRYREQLKKQRRLQLEDIINRGTFPPLSLQEAARQLDCATDTLRRNSPDLCYIIVERYQSYMSVRKVERDQRVVSEIRQAVFYLYSEGVYPGMRKVEVITRPGYMREPLATNAWREALGELGLGNELD